MRIAAALTLRICLAPAAFGQSREDNGVAGRSGAQPPTDQIIVKWRDGTAATANAAGLRAQKLGASAGMRLQRKQQIATQTDVLQLDRALGAADMNALLQRMAADPNVEYAVADERRWPHALPGDPLFADQWYFQSVQIAATHAEQAWDVTVGSNLTVGCRARYRGALRPSGSRPWRSGRPAASPPDSISSRASRTSRTTATRAMLTPSDPGDWIDSTDEDHPPPYANCEPVSSTSSWHGTRVAGMIGALTQQLRGRIGPQLEFIHPSGARAR